MVKGGVILGYHYYVNNNQTRNPGLHHEVHTEEHAKILGIYNKTYLGYYGNEIEADTCISAKGGGRFEIIQNNLNI